LRNADKVVYEDMEMTSRTDKKFSIKSRTSSKDGVVDRRVRASGPPLTSPGGTVTGHSKVVHELKAENFDLRRAAITPVKEDGC
jgi:hypothetical protein